MSASEAQPAEPQLPDIRTPLPGPRASAWVATLAQTECPALTARRARRSEQAGASHDPIVWAEAHDSTVVDSDGNRFVDLTAGFGVAAIGHRHPRVVQALHAQSERLIHALGDVHPSDVKVRLLERLTGLAPWPSARVILGLNGSDAVEAALKTAMLATGKPGVLAFTGGYHGLSHGPLAACGYRDAFRSPFQAQLNPHVSFASYPHVDQVDAEQALEDVQEVWDRCPHAIGAVLVEPLLGRGGVVVPPPGFLAQLARLCHSRGALLIADEIFTGLGRCGARWLSVEDALAHDRVEDALRHRADADALPDLLLTGKALGGGLPISACIGREEVMQAWGDPTSEALHTATFAGHPLAAATALATLDVLEQTQAGERANELGQWLRTTLQALQTRHPRIRGVRGCGLLLGVVMDEGARTLRMLRALLERGYITIPAGPDAQVLSLTPPLCIAQAQLQGFVDALDACLQHEG